MIITCQNCRASYRLDEALLDPDGSRVRCTSCGHVFIARAPVTAPPVGERPPAPEAETDDFDDELDFGFADVPASPAKDDDFELHLEDDEGDGAGRDLDPDPDFDELELDLEPAAARQRDAEPDLEAIRNMLAIPDEAFEALAVDDRPKAGSATEIEPDLDLGDLGLPPRLAEETSGPAEQAAPERGEESAAGEAAGVFRSLAGETDAPDSVLARETAGGPGRRSSTWLIVVAVLLGLIGGGFYWARQRGLDMTFFTRLVGRQPADEAGNLNIGTLALDSRFITNAIAGRLFVVEGKVRNDYDHPRSHIRIQGRLVAGGKRPVSSETVFCGNVLTELDLRSLEIAEIKRRLGLKTGARASNIDVPPGGLVPFMVVFDDLPPKPEEFVIEVVSSH